MNHLKKLLPFIYPYWQLAVLSLVLLTTVVFIDLAIPRLIQQIIDKGVNQHNMNMVIDGHTGLLVPPGSPGALAEALATVAGSPDTGKAMGIAGRIRAHAEFSLDGMVRRYEALYLELALRKCRIAQECFVHAG